jgi:hypothetical protein
MELIPFEQSRRGPGARKMMADAASEFMRIISKRSENIKNPIFVQEKWRQYCRERRNSYMSDMLGHGRVWRRLNRHGKLVRWFYSTKKLLTIQNVVRCEAHREVLETIFDETSGLNNHRRRES